MRHTVLFAAMLVVASIAGVTSIAGAAPAVQGASATVQNGDCSFPYTATDASGTEVTIEQRPERVTTLNPSAAQTMWEIGGKGQVVGTSRFAHYLDGAESRTNVSAGFGADVEKVVGTDPDLVLAPNTTSADTVESLRAANVTVFLFEMATSIEDVSSKTTTIGRLTGNCDGAARTNAWMNANVQVARNATADVDDVRALYPLGEVVAGGETFISDMIGASGGTNVAAEEVSGYGDLSDETVIQLAPEMLVVTDATRGVQSTQPYSSTPAGENNATVHVDTNYLNQPAPRSVVYSVRNLTAGFHPDVEAEFVARSEVTVGQGNTTDGSTEGDATGDDATDSDGQPGFGVPAALAAALVVAIGLRRT